MAIVNSKSWPVVTQASNAQKGKLVRVKRNGTMVKMYEADAIAQGLIPGKAKPPAANKMQPPPGNKASAAAPEEKPAEKPPADDFTTILGLGPASARALAAHGVATFEQLRAAADLGYLSARAQEAIETWRHDG